MEFNNHAIDRQLKGFLKTHQLLNSQSISPYPNFDVKDILISPDVSHLEKELKNFLYVGKRMEIFFTTTIENHPDYNLILHSLQLRNEQKTTLGEIDFLVEDVKLQQIIHVELVFKFYIFDPDYHSDDLMCFMGPKRKDFLKKKLHKLHTHQFPILFTKECQEALSKLQIHPKNIQQKLCYKAQVYLPYNKKVSLPSYINSDCISGFWLKFVDFEKLSKDSTFIIPQRQDWMEFPDFSVYVSNDFWSAHTAVEKLIQQGHAPMLWEKSKEGKINSYFITID